MAPHSHDPVRNRHRDYSDGANRCREFSDGCRVHRVYVRITSVQRILRPHNITGNVCGILGDAQCLSCLSGNKGLTKRDPASRKKLVFHDCGRFCRGFGSTGQAYCGISSRPRFVSSVPSLRFFSSIAYSLIGLFAYLFITFMVVAGVDYAVPGRHSRI